MIGIVPHRLRKEKNLGSLLLEDLIWPISKPKKGVFVIDLGEHDHIITYPYSRHIFFKKTKLPCHISLILPEPRVIHRLYYILLPIISYKYAFVFTRYKKLSTLTNNIVAVTLARSNIPSNISGLPISQRKKVSIVASNKNQTEGHKLRHKLIKELRANNVPIDVLGRGYRPYEQDHEGILPYSYSVIIENSQEDNYFTEKIINCLLCRTVPIYWGCRDISDYFDTSNWIVFNTLNEAIEAVQSIEIQEPNTSLIEKNYREALKYQNPDKLCAEYIRNQIRDR